ncbi:UNVERIFIED_ORG: hypothetical protein DFO49_0168 [Herbaspirillum seropedicae]
MDSTIEERYVRRQQIVLLDRDPMSFKEEKKFIKIYLQLRSQAAPIVNTPFEMIILIHTFIHLLSRYTNAFGRLDKCFTNDIDAIFFHHLNFSS